MFHEGALTRVHDSDLEAVHTGCPFCKWHVIEATGVFVQFDPDVEYLRCSNCRAVFASRAPKAQFLADFYHPEGYEGTISRSQERARRLAKSILCGPLQAHLIRKRAVSVLDFGGGSGSLGLEIKALLGSTDTRVTLVDLHEPANTSEVDFLTPNELLVNSDRRFDLVMLSAVVEHLAEPGRVIEDLYHRVCTGGFLYFRAPSLFPLAKFRPRLLRWPEHLADLSPRFWHELPRALNWNISVVSSRPSQSSDLWREDLFAALLANCMKLPGRLEALMFSWTKGRYIPRYGCAGGWDALYQKL